MKRSYLNLIVGVVLMLIVFLACFTFQVRQTQVAVVTTFGKPTRNLTDPGLYFRWPWPIQEVYPLDKRIQNFETKYEETTTKDGQNLLITVYVGWNIADPGVFFPKFGNGSIEDARKNLDGLISSRKNEVVGTNKLSHFISTDPNEMMFANIEKEILARVKDEALKNYGINIQFLGIKQLGLPESNTESVFNRMKSERQKLVSLYKAEGDSLANNIRVDADLKRDTMLNDAAAQARLIRGDAESKATAALTAFNQDPDLAIFLTKLEALKQTLKENSQLVLDQKAPPFDLLGNTGLTLTNKTTLP